MGLGHQRPLRGDRPHPDCTGQCFCEVPDSDALPITHWLALMLDWPFEGCVSDSPYLHLMSPVTDLDSDVS